MVKCLKIPLKRAEIIRKKFDTYITYNYLPEKGKKYIYFALRKIPDKIPKGIEIINKALKKREKKPKNIKDILKNLMNEKELNELVSSFEVLNTIAIIEIPNSLEKYEQQIGNAVMQMHKNIKTVLKKETGMSGKFRIRKVKVITGEKNFVTTYKENSCLFKLDISNMFYSTKLSTDRKRIAEQSGRNENILVPFAGYGPFAITIAKKNPKTKVVGIELNPEAVKYFEENIKLNKLNNCKALLGDASKIVEKYPEFKKWADRIIMPLPKNALDFLPYVLKCAKTGTILHIYAFDSKAGEYLNAQHLNAFDSKEYPFERKIKKVEIIAKKYGFKTKLLNKKLVRPYAPNVFQICLDIQII